MRKCDDFMWLLSQVFVHGACRDERSALIDGWSIAGRWIVCAIWEVAGEFCGAVLGHIAQVRSVFVVPPFGGVVGGAEGDGVAHARREQRAAISSTRSS
jgi:hypothetical protein